MAENYVVCCNTGSGSSLVNKTAVLKVIFDEQNIHD